MGRRCFYFWTRDRSAVSLCPQKLVRPRDLRPTQQALLAANGTQIFLVGQADIKLRIDGVIEETLHGRPSEDVGDALEQLVNEHDPEEDQHDWEVEPIQMGPKRQIKAPRRYGYDEDI